MYILFRKFATLQRVAEERTGDHIYKLHYHMQPLSSGIAEDSEDSTIAMAAQSMCGEIISEEVFSIFHGRNRKSLPLLQSREQEHVSDSEWENVYICKWEKMFAI